MTKFCCFLITLLCIQQINPFQPAENLSQDNGISSTGSLSLLKINSKGHFKGLIILVEFPDTPFTIAQANQRFNDLLNKEKYDYQGAYGSVRDYFIENSDSLFFPEFTVIGPVNLKKPMSYYGENGENGEEIHAGEMIMDACKIASSQIEFSEYDTNEDGLVDRVYIIFASYCENENPTQKEFIWSHAGNIADSCLVINNKTIERYACSSEYIGEKSDNPALMATIGTFCHKFSHILGLPDFRFHKKS